MSAPPAALAVTHRHPWVLVAGIALPVAVAVLAWWAGSALNFLDQGTDYATAPPSPLSPGLLLPGVLALAALAAAVVVWVRAAASRRLRPAWWVVQALASGAGLVTGFCLAVIFVDTVDANIGAGLAVLFGGPLVVVLLAGAAAVSLVLARARGRRAWAGEA
ncbi:MAG: hypothetical protein GEV10_06915 [Streptosporangiales bacterium]|nr:hypothetical protein [Streptosporangiales bacterium]